MSPKQSTAKARARSRRKSILVVDDEPGTVGVLLAVLADAGYEVSGAVHGRDALARLAQARPDLILLDFVMPVLDGAETLKALQADTRTARIPVVMMSGIPESMIKRRCRGYDAFLRKPYSLTELLGIVERLLETSARGQRV